MQISCETNDRLLKTNILVSGADSNVHVMNCLREQLLLKTRCHRLVSAQFPIIYLYTLFLTY